MRYILYARKSTEEDDRQVLSIEAQLVELQEYAAKEKLEIVASFQEAKTAKEEEKNIGANHILIRGKEKFFNPIQKSRKSLFLLRLIFKLIYAILATLSESQKPANFCGKVPRRTAP